MTTKEPIGMKLTFTSFRDSMRLEGLKLSIDRRPPRHCEYPVLTYLVVPTMRNLAEDNMEKICISVLDNNWALLRAFIGNMYAIGIHQMVLCDWCVKSQIERGKFCPAGIIGSYIQDKVDRDGVFDFPIEICYEDGRGSAQ